MEQSKTPQKRNRRREGVAEFEEALRGVARQLKSLPRQRTTVVHHNDADGIASGAVLKRALGREGFETENIPLERIHPSFLPKIHSPDRTIIFYADLGAQGTPLISRQVRRETTVFILDHHPPFQSSVPGLRHVNPENFGIDGDVSCSAATVAYLFGRALNPANDDLSYLGVMGALGDGQVVDGGMISLNRVAVQQAEATGTLRRVPGDPRDPFRFSLFGDQRGTEVARSISDLAVNGYYSGGADLAIRTCLEGHTETSRGLALELRRRQEERFERAKEWITIHGIASEAELQWFDAGNRFYPLGLKAIGLFCSEISRGDWVSGEKYIVGFQDFPKDNPYLGPFTAEETKVSMRVPPPLRRSIERGQRPALSTVLPMAAEEVGGFAEACHRYAAACSIPRERKKELLQALRRIIAEKSQKGGT